MEGMFIIKSHILALLPTVNCLSIIIHHRNSMIECHPQQVFYPENSAKIQRHFKYSNLFNFGNILGSVIIFVGYYLVDYLY